jgi:hypothetical protein
VRALYVRHAGDFALLHDDPVVLGQWRCRIGRYLEGLHVRLHPRKTAIVAAELSGFLDFVLRPGGGRRVV